jgi:hypothetical protein
MSDGPFGPFRGRDDRLVVGGKVTSMPGPIVRQNVMRIVEDGNLLAVISRDPKTGDVAVMVLGPPSLALVEELEQAAIDLRKTVEETLS